MKSNNKIPLVNNNLFIEKPNLLNKSVNIGKNSFGINPIIILKSHLDSVRCLHLINDSKMLITAGDDMLINFWDLKKILCSQKESHEPFLSIRGHNNPIFTLTGNEQFVFSSGMDGIIRNWKIPKVKKIFGIMKVSGVKMRKISRKMTKTKQKILALGLIQGCL